MEGVFQRRFSKNFTLWSNIGVENLSWKRYYRWHITMSVNITTTDDIDISREYDIKQNIPQVGRDISTIITWLNNKPLEINTKYKIKHTTNEIIIMVTEILYEIDVNSLRKILNTDQLTLNKIGRVKLNYPKIYFTILMKKINTGGFIIIDSHNNNTVGAGYII